MTTTCLFLARCGRTASLVMEAAEFAGSAAGLGTSGEVGEGEALVLLQRGEVEVLGAKED